MHGPVGQTSNDNLQLTFPLSLHPSETGDDLPVELVQRAGDGRRCAGPRSGSRCGSPSVRQQWMMIHSHSTEAGGRWPPWYAQRRPCRPPVRSSVTARRFLCGPAAGGEAGEGVSTAGVRELGEGRPWRAPQVAPHPSFPDAVPARVRFAQREVGDPPHRGPAAGAPVAVVRQSSCSVARPPRTTPDSLQHGHTGSGTVSTPSLFGLSPCPRRAPAARGVRHRPQTRRQETGLPPRVSSRGDHEAARRSLPYTASPYRGGSRASPHLVDCVDGRTTSVCRFEDPPCRSWRFTLVGAWAGGRRGQPGAVAGEHLSSPTDGQHPAAQGHLAVHGQRRSTLRPLAALTLADDHGAPARGRPWGSPPPARDVHAVCFRRALRARVRWSLPATS